MNQFLRARLAPLAAAPASNRGSSLLLLMGTVFSLLNLATMDLPSMSALVVRTATWFGLAAIVLRYEFVRRFTVMQYNLFWLTVAFGLWPPGTLVALTLFPGHPTTRVVLAALAGDSHTLMLANDLIFLFTWVSSYTYLLSRSRLELRGWYSDIDIMQVRRDRETWRLLGVGLLAAGTFASIVKPYARQEFDQPLTLVTTLRLGGVFALALIAFSARRETAARFTDWALFVSGLAVVAVFGFFQGQGHKGALLVVMFMLWTLYMSLFPARKKVATFTLVVVGVAMIPFLPVLNTFKSVAMEENVTGVSDGVRAAGGVSAMNVSAQMGDDVSNVADYFMQYFFSRVTLTYMTAQYVRSYEGNHAGISFLGPIIYSFVPRVLYRDKIDANEYYNEFARNSGVGNFDDLTTSRKPNLIEESYSISGMVGVLIAAIGYGLLIASVERVLSAMVFRQGLGLMIGFIGCQNLGANYIANIIAGVVFYFVGYCIVARVGLAGLFDRQEYRPQAKRK